MTLAEYYATLGYPPSRWHVGLEHPTLEQRALALLRDRPRARVLEIGYQAGGFAAPIILALRDRPGFSYVGVDSAAYANAVAGAVIADYLVREGVPRGYEFVSADAGDFLAHRATPTFDLVLLDHDKRYYPRDLQTVFRRGLVSDDGYVLLHDVLGKAARAWGDCAAIGHAWGWEASVLAEVPEGLAVLRKARAVRPMSAADRVRFARARIGIHRRRVVDAWRLSRRAGARA